jgi:hypothetical protein
MKAVMLGACLAAIVGAPALAQPGDGYRDQPDPYYDQAPPQRPAPPSEEGGYQSDQGYGQYQAPPGEGGYQNDQGYGRYQAPQQPPAGEGGYQSDQGYGRYQPPPPPPAGQPGFQVYQGGQSNGGYAPDNRAYQAAPQRRYDGGAGFTGDVGRAWRNPEGQICRWRQLSWQDAYGRPAYKWVPHCRDD